MKKLPFLMKTKKLPRLALMGFVPVMISYIVPMPLNFAMMLQTWGMLFMGLFWMEGMALSYRCIHNIEMNAKAFKIIQHLDNIEEMEE